MVIQTIFARKISIVSNWTHTMYQSALKMFPQSALRQSINHQLVLDGHKSIS